MKFTKQQVIDGAFKKYGKPVSLDFLSDAMECETLEDAIDLIVADSCYWDGELE